MSRDSSSTVTKRHIRQAQTQKMVGGEVMENCGNSL